MNLSTKGRYGLRAMVELALHYGEGPILLKEIAKRQEISEKYLEQLIIPLKIASMVKSTRGAHGGYELTVPPEQIKVYEVIQVLEGSLAPVGCIDNPTICPRSSTCVTRDLWMRMKQSMVKVLNSITLAELAEQQKSRQRTGNLMYHI
ncbi:hypothetical protein DRQ11_10495 [candidate division KSB1 bacterium]|nr:MAG: hypothetical protein DRQ11_10495 [candidate division KSB1 bacterium]